MYLRLIGVIDLGAVNMGVGEGRGRWWGEGWGNLGTINGGSTLLRVLHGPSMRGVDGGCVLW